MKSHPYGFTSICINDDLCGEMPMHAHTPPVFATSTFLYPSVEHAVDVFTNKKDAFVYSRISHPNADLIEKKVALLEGFHPESPKPYTGLAFSSGMAAIQTLLTALDLREGDTLLTQGNMYGTTVDLLNTLYLNRNIKVVYADFSQKVAIEKVLNSNNPPKVVYMETPCNPTLACFDLAFVTSITNAKKIPLIVDNTFASPYFQRPLQFGADFVIHSTTKYLNGHGTSTGGIVVGKDATFMKSNLANIRKLAGTILPPFDAWLLNNGIKTLPFRMEKHQENAFKIAAYLSKHPKIETVFYPGISSNEGYAIARKQMTGYGGMMSFKITGKFEDATRFLNNLHFCKMTATLGTADTLIQHPASMTHVNVPKEQREAFGIHDNLIRMSVGLENVEDIIADLEQAFGAI